MNAYLEITADREIKIHVDLPENASDYDAYDYEPDESHPAAWVSFIHIFNTSSYLDGVVVYAKEDFEEPEDYEGDYYSDDATVFEYVITDQDINVMDAIINTDSCHPTDALNDIIIVDIGLSYYSNYEAVLPYCNLAPSTITTSLYYPCPLYTQAINAIGGCNCKDMCEDNLPYGFMYALLKKKAIDACLECGHYDQACRYYNKFYKTDNCSCKKKGCGCSSSSSSYTASSSSSTTTKNCGCNG